MRDIDRWGRWKDRQTVRKKERSCYNETCNCWIMHYDHSVWPASKDKRLSMNAWTIHMTTHKHAHMCAYMHSDSLDCNHATFLKVMKGFSQRITLSASDHCTWRRRTTIILTTKQQLHEKNSNNCKNITNTETSHYHHQIPKQQLNHHHNHHHLQQQQQHSDNNHEG